MSTAVVLNENLERAGEAEVPASFLEAGAHKAYQASLRSNTAHSKNRSAVSGGGKKPWAQKGRGGARAGSIRSKALHRGLYRGCERKDERCRLHDGQAWRT